MYLDDMLEAFGSVDGTEGSQHTKNPENLDDGNGTGTEIFSRRRKRN
jgi:hypothetical protein